MIENSTTLNLTNINRQIEEQRDLIRELLDQIADNERYISQIDNGDIPTYDFNRIIERRLQILAKEQRNAVSLMELINRQSEYISRRVDEISSRLDRLST